MLTDDMRAVIRAAHLCFVATVSEDGRPNVSPKGTLGVWDAQRLFFLDIASPGTHANLEQRPWLELNVVEQTSRRGYRFAGRAELHQPGSAEYGEGVRRIYGDTPPVTGPVAVIIVTVDRAAPLLSPAYWRGLDETALRAQWKERRRQLDAEFEGYLKQVPAVRVTPEGS